VTATNIWTVGSIAKRYGVAPWQVRRLFERGLLPEPCRLGFYRVLDEADLPVVEDALRRAGYLREGGPDRTAAEPLAQVG
jgi:hypothetical protein